MATHFFGITDRTFAYSHSVGRNEFGGTGFRNPVDLALADNDVVYVVNRSYENRSDGELSGPSSLAVTSDGNLLVSDTQNHRIQAFSLDGRYVAQCGSFGNGPGQFNMPWGLNLDAEGNMFVADWRNDRIQKLSPDGECLAIYGSSGSGTGQFNRPSDVCVDQDGDIYVADRQNDRV